VYRPHIANNLPLPKGDVSGGRLLIEGKQFTPSQLSRLSQPVSGNVTPFAKSGLFPRFENALMKGVAAVFTSMGPAIFIKALSPKDALASLTLAQAPAVWNLEKCQQQVLVTDADLSIADEVQADRNIWPVPARR
jgi:hypothetical protein